jgi:glutathione peroxidase
MSLYDIPLTTSTGESTTLAAYKGKVLYIVNVASKCGLTPQYEALEALYKKYNGDVVVLGFPANDFLAQEPGSDSDIQEFCSLKYNVCFCFFF